MIWLAAALPAAALQGAAPEPPRAAVVVAAMDRLDTARLWPGFEPLKTPLAVFDGQRTWLFRQARAPEGFAAAANLARVFSYEGRHPAVTANSAAEIGGALAGVLMIEAGDGRSTEELAGLLVHEAFHVFQAARHPDWVGNEADLLTYPMDNVELLALRRFESAALRKALAGDGQAATAAWALAAVALRRERLARLDEAAAAYERGTELKEGLAQYVEDLATASPALRRWPDAEFPPDEVRQRCYASGQALAVLLDRLAPGWKPGFDSSPGRLEDLLENAARNRSAAPAVIGADERLAIARRVPEDVEALTARRSTERSGFLAQPGWTLVVTAAPTAPLSPLRFDPLNLLRLAGSELLHRRFVRLAGPSGTIEVLGRASLTEGAGQHPLYNGIRSLTVTGLAAEPAVARAADGAQTITAAGVTASFRGARVEREGKKLTVRLAEGGR